MKKFYAIPENLKEEKMLRSESYDEVLDMAKSRLAQDPSIKSYEIVEVISKVHVSVDVNVECYNGNYLEEIKSKWFFDPLPAGLPAPPTGFVYFGKKPIYKISDDLPYSMNIALFIEHWHLGKRGTDVDAHYAVMAGTKQYDDAMEAHRKGGPI
jgi:hypothetical protein